MKEWFNKLEELQKEFFENLKNRKEESIKSLEEFKEKLQNEIDNRLDYLYAKKDFIKQALSKETKEKNKPYYRSFLVSLLHIHIRHLLSIPFIYAMIIPAIILDIFLEIYHRICFPLYGIPIVKRSDYFVLDRRFLSYLNWFEKFNCLYCSYFNNLIAYTREIAWRTEKYWCPIKHSKRLPDPHPHYEDFAEYIDWEDFRTKYNNPKCFDKSCDN